MNLESPGRSADPTGKIRHTTRLRWKTMVAPAPRTLSVTFSVIITSFVDSALEMWGFERSWFTVFCWLTDPISHHLWKWETPPVKVLGCVLRPSFLLRRSKEACVLLRVLRICTSQRELWPLGEGPNVFLVGKHRWTHMKRRDCCWMLFVEGTEPKAISLKLEHGVHSVVSM